jgi:pSer/pThr/pTyr-binding forkhead associated (FHA) protein
MSAPFFVELLNRNGEVEQRVRVEQLPIRIGRSYENEVILDDEHVAARHAIVEENADGNLQIRDLDSRNGMSSQGRRQSQLELTGHTVVRLGQSHLRVRRSNFEVEPETVDTSNYQWEGWRPALAGVAIISSLTWLSTWLSQTDGFNLLVYLQAVISVLLAALLWSGIWAAANRLFGRNPRFGRHLFIVASAMLFLQTWNALASFLGFMFSWEWFTRYGSHIDILVLAIAIYMHLSTIKRRYTRGLLMTSLFCSALGSGLILMTHQKNTGTFADELYMGDIFAPGLHIAHDEDVDHFAQAADKLKSQVDKDRSKILAPGEMQMEED